MRQEEIVWMEVYAGEKSTKSTVRTSGSRMRRCRSCVTTGLDQGAADDACWWRIRSINVAMRPGARSLRLPAADPVLKACRARSRSRKRPTWSSSAENSEDIYAGIEYEAESDKAKKLIDFLQKEMGVKKIASRQLPASVSSRSRGSTERLVRKASSMRSSTTKSLTFVHKGNIMKFTEGAFAKWGYELHSVSSRPNCWTVAMMKIKAAATS